MPIKFTKSKSGAPVPLSAALPSNDDPTFRKIGDGMAECVLCGGKLLNKASARNRHLASQRHQSAVAATKLNEGK